jgi:type IV pilus assembly protein PilW
MNPIDPIFIPPTHVAAQRIGREAGLSIIELMIAMLISLFLLGGLIHLFIQNRATHQTQSAIALIQENARYLTTYMGRELRMAGYMGCNADVDITNHLNTPDSNAWNMTSYPAGISVHRYDGSNYSPALDSGLSFSNVMANSDVVILRRMADDVISFSAGDFDFNPDASPFFTVNTGSALDTFINEGDILFASNCQDKAIIIQACKGSGGPPGTEKYSVTNCGASYSPGNQNPAPVSGYDTLLTGAGELSRFSATAFYINTDGDLMTSTFGINLAGGNYTPQMAAQPILRGINNLRLELGIDTDDDNIADTFQFAESVSGFTDGWKNVVSIRVHYSLDSREIPGPQVTRDITTLINLRNRTG